MKRKHDMHFVSDVAVIANQQIARIHFVLISHLVGRRNGEKCLKSAAYFYVHAQASSRAQVSQVFSNYEGKIR